MTALADLRSLVRDFQTQHDLDQRLLAIYRRGVEDGAQGALSDCMNRIGLEYEYEFDERIAGDEWVDEIVGRVR